VAGGVVDVPLQSETLLPQFMDPVVPTRLFCVAQAAALRETPGGWSVVQDPVTGSTALWNAQTRRTIITSVG
jgi:hypothetical protein